MYMKCVSVFTTQNYMLSSGCVHFCTQFETSESDNDEIFLEIIVSIFHRLGVVICSWGWVERWKESRHVFNPHTWCHMHVMVSQNTATSLLVQPLVHINNTKNIKATHDWTFVRGMHRWPMEPHHQPLPPPPQRASNEEIVSTPWSPHDKGVCRITTGLACNKGYLLYNCVSAWRGTCELQGDL